MPSARLPLVPLQQSGSESLAGAAPVAHNIVLDDVGSVIRRPGLKASSLAVDSVVDTDGLSGLRVAYNGALYVVADGSPPRSVYSVDPAGAASMGTIGGDKRPVFAETEALLLIAGGQRIHKVTLASNLLDRLAGDPPKATHVVAHAGRLISNNLTVQNRVNYSGVATGGATAGHEDWSTGSGTGGLFNAEARPDPVVAVGENTNELFVWGTTSTQAYVTDPQFVYSPAATREYGLLAPYSIVNRDQQFAWLDHRRRFMVGDVRTAQVISGPIQRTLDELSTVTDCFGYRVHLGPVDALVWTFPSDGRTFVFSGGLWSQWSGWNGNWTVFRVLSHHQDPNTGKNLVGDTNGRISELDLSTHTDRGDTIRAYVQTGFENHDTDKVKHCKAVHVALRRGETSSDTAPQAFLGWRDAPGLPFRRIPISLGTAGQREPVVTLRGMGTYRRRQWFFEFSGSEELALASVTEEYSVGGT